MQFNVDLFPQPFIREGIIIISIITDNDGPSIDGMASDRKTYGQDSTGRRNYERRRLPASLPPWTIKNPPIQWNDNTIPYLLTGSGLWPELLGGRFLAKNAKDPVMINISLATLVSLF